MGRYEKVKSDMTGTLGRKYLYLAKWTLRSPWTAPLSALRILVGCWAILFTWDLRFRYEIILGQTAILDADTWMQRVPDLSASLFRIALVENHLRGFQVVTMVAAIGLLLGFRTRLCAGILLVTLISWNRSVYPLASSTDVALSALLFWSMLLPISARWSLDAYRNGSQTRGTRLNVVGFILFMCSMVITNITDGIVDPFNANFWLSIAAILGFFSLIPQPRSSSYGFRLELSTFFCLVALLALPGRILADYLNLNKNTEVLEKLSWDIGALDASVKPETSVTPSPVRAVVRGTSSSVDVETLWSNLWGIERAWTYLHGDHRPLRESLPTLTHLKASLRQGLANRACATRESSGIIDVFTNDSEKHEALLSFKCVAGRGRLVPRAIPDSYAFGPASYARKKELELALDSGTLREVDLQEYLYHSYKLNQSVPVRELVLLAHVRTGAFELEEAQTLVEIALSHVSPNERKVFPLLEELLKRVKQKIEDL